MRFVYTILYVKDVPKSILFYEQAFGLKHRFLHESEQYAEMETETTTLAFAANELARSNLTEGFQENSLSNLHSNLPCLMSNSTARAAKYDRNLSTHQLIFDRLLLV